MPDAIARPPGPLVAENKEPSTEEGFNFLVNKALLELQKGKLESAG
jgi:hypothetical protein